TRTVEPPTRTSISSAPRRADPSPLAATLRASSGRPSLLHRFGFPPRRGFTPERSRTPGPPCASSSINCTPPLSSARRNLFNVEIFESAPRISKPLIVIAATPDCSARSSLDHLSRARAAYNCSGVSIPCSVCHASRRRNVAILVSPLDYPLLDS